MTRVIFVIMTDGSEVLKETMTGIYIGVSGIMIYIVSYYDDIRLFISPE